MFRAEAWAWGWTRSDGAHRSIVLDTTRPLRFGSAGFLLTRDTERLHFVASVEDIAPTAVPEQMPVVVTFRVPTNVRCTRLVDGRFVLPVELASYSLGRAVARKTPRSHLAQHPKRSSNDLATGETDPLSGAPVNLVSLSWRRPDAAPRARVLVAPPAVAELNPERRPAFMAPLQAVLGELRGCFEAELKVRPSLQGAIVVRVDIDARGYARERAVVVDTLSAPPLAGCALDLLRRTRFAVRPFSGHLTFYFRHDE